MQLHDTLNHRLTEDMPDGPSMPARPWSAAEPRWNADRMFSRFAVSMFTPDLYKLYSAANRGTGRG